MRILIATLFAFLVSPAFAGLVATISDVRDDEFDFSLSDPQAPRPVSFEVLARPNGELVDFFYGQSSLSSTYTFGPLMPATNYEFRTAILIAGNEVSQTHDIWTTAMDVDGQAAAERIDEINGPLGDHTGLFVRTVILQAADDGPVARQTLKQYLGAGLRAVRQAQGIGTVTEAVSVSNEISNRPNEFQESLR